jgi:hypothetical protein
MNFLKKINKKYNHLKFYNFDQRKIKKHNFDNSKNYLIISPHPDDELLYSSAVLLSSKNNVTVMCFSHGDKHSIRSNEFLKLMNILNLQDSKIFNYDEGDMVNYDLEIDYLKYDYIFVPNFFNSHFDHYKFHLGFKDIISKINYKGLICQYEDNGTLPFPNYYMDIGNIVEKKFHFFKKYYKSQYLISSSFADSIKALNFYRGKLAGVMYAEFFTFFSKKEYLKFIND